MKSASGAMDTLLSSGGPFFIADLYTITLQDTTVLRYTNCDVPLTVSGQTYLNNGPILKRDKTRLTLGLETSSMTVSIYADDTVLLGGIPMLQAFRIGALDGATLQVDMLIAPDWTNVTAGAITMFIGTVTDVELSRIEAKVTVSGLTDKFDMVLPKNPYAPGCANTLFDTNCKAVKASFTIAKSVSAISTNYVVQTSSTSMSPYSRWSQGSIIFTSGVNNGKSRSIKSASGSGIVLSNPLTLPPGIGDTFNLVMGCDHTRTTCTGVFSNLVNFRGFPYVPNPESIA